MKELTNTEKLNYLRKRIEKIGALNDLFMDSLTIHEFDENTDKFKLIYDMFDKLIWESLRILGDDGDDFKL